MSRKIALEDIRDFDWDKGNAEKNWFKHRITIQEAEEIFYNAPFVSEDNGHSEREERFQALGKTNIGRLLFVSFTIRKINAEFKIRIISARDTNKKEEVEYEKETKTNTKF